MKISRNKIIVGAAIVVIVISSILIKSWFGSGRYERLAYGYFYDLTTNEIFVDKRDVLPPIRDGHGVRAVVTACGSCGDPASRVVAWLEKFTDEAKQVIAAESAKAADAGKVDEAEHEVVVRAITQGRLVARKPDGGKVQWVTNFSVEGIAIQSEALASCPGKVKFCTPTKGELP